MTAVIMKAIQDCSQSTFDKEIAYVSPRACVGGAIKSTKSNIKELRSVRVVGYGDTVRLNSLNDSENRPLFVEKLGSDFNVVQIADGETIEV